MSRWFAAGAIAICTLAISGAADSGGAFKLEKAKVKGGDNIEIKFSGARKSTAASREWVNVTLAKNPDSDWGVWKYVDDGAKNMVLAAPKAPGKYEVRLHDQYPAKNFHVVEREPLEIH